MKILINTSNLKQGGGVQVANSFINSLKKETDEFIIVLNRITEKGINKKEFPENFIFLTVHFEFIKFFKFIKQLNLIEQKFKPHIVFSVFGPSYWTPKARHIMGYAIPHYVYRDSPFFQRISVKFKVKLIITEIIHAYFIKKNAQIYITETEDVRIRLSRRFNIPKKNIHTVSNSCHQIFNNYTYSEKPSKECYSILTLSAFYPHKNLDIIKKVAPLLEGKISARFILTLPKETFEKEFKGASDTIENIGPQPIEKCPELYQNAHLMFLPTLLECFTASYLEAFLTKTPIITSNLSFAKDICGDAAVFVNPTDPHEIAKAIIDLYNDECLQSQLIKNGLLRLNKFETAKKRAEIYLDLCKTQYKSQII